MAVEGVFTPGNGDTNGVKLDESKKTVTKAFKFNVKSIEEECPNLAKDRKSFISF